MIEHAWVVLCMREGGNPRAGEGGDMDYMMDDHCLYCLEILHFLAAGFISKQWMELAGGYQKWAKLVLGVLRCMYVCMVQLYVHVDERDQSVKLVLLVLVSSRSCVVVVA